MLNLYKVAIKDKLRTSKMYEKKLKIDDKEYGIEDLSEKAKNILKSLQYSDQRLKELNQMLLFFKTSKHNSLTKLKKEMLSQKGGFSLDDNN